MQHLQQPSSREKTGKTSTDGFRDVTIPIMADQGSSSSRRCTTKDKNTSSFKEVAIPILAERTSNSHSCSTDMDYIAQSSCMSPRSSTTALFQEPSYKMSKLDNTDELQTEIPSSQQFTEADDELMGNLFKFVPTARPDHQPVTSSPLRDFVEGELDNMWTDICNTPNEQGELEEETSDFYEDIEENLTLTFNESESLTRQANNEQPAEPQDPAKPNYVDDKAPLYITSKVTVGTTIVLLALFAIKYNLAADAIAHILSLLSLVLPAGHILPTTLNRFKNYFRNLRDPLIMHYYCSFCLAYVGKNDRMTCPNSGCLKDLTKKGAMSYFVEIPILHQLRTFFSRATFYDDIQHRFKRPKQPDDIITDIYDGRLYRELHDKGILNCKDNVSFIMNTDGVPVFKSSKVSIWPLYLIINELPYRKRMAKENMLLSGLWFGEKKPAMWTFLKPHFEGLHQLEGGIELEAPGRGKFTCRGVVLAWTCDLPARCLVCNSMQYNGEYGCWKCLQPGKTVKADGGHARAFLYQTDNPKGPLRNKEDTIRHAQEAASQQQAGGKSSNVKGVKGPTWFSLLAHHDIVRGVAIDYMHGVLLGVQKLLLRLWFSAKFSRKPYSISYLAGTLDERLQHISPTLDINRLPRSVTDHLQYWKANELRSFLLYYGIPTLYGLLSDTYFSHYVLFVHAIYLLLKDKISESDLCEAEHLLNKFCALFSDLYEERFMTLNMHQLLHLPDDVRDLGPLYTHSCFSFEDKNGFILKQIHGSQFIDSQITYALTLTQKIPELRENCIAPGSEEEKLYVQLSCSSKPKRGPEILPGVFILGTPYKKTIDDDTFKALEQFLGHAPGSVNVTTYNRIEHHSSYIYGTSYKRMSRRNCATIKYQIDGCFHFGQVKYFVQYQEANFEHVYQLALVQPLTCHAYNPSSHISVITLDQEANPVIFVDVRSICSNCIYVSLPDVTERAYVCEFPNKCELE